MKKLTTLLAAIAMTATLAGGCGGKKDPEKKDDTTAGKAVQPDDKKPADPAKPDETKPADPAKPDDKVAQAPTGDFPAECAEYKAMVDKLADCQKLAAETRDGLKGAFQQSWTAWEKTADKQTIVAACKAGAETVKTAAGTVCGW